MDWITKIMVKFMIYPFIVDLPKTNSRCVEVKKGDTISVYDLNHTIINGYVVPEGVRNTEDWNKYRAAKRTVKTICEIRKKYKHVFLRVSPEVSSGYIYMRLITERDSDA